MKQLIILFLIICTSAAAQPSKTIALEKKVEGRIHLDEKANESLHILPRMLLTAFCQGQIKAYYPNAPETEMSFDNFVAYFKFPYKPISDSSANACVCSLCKNLDADFIDAFSKFIDYGEVERFNTASSSYSYETEYLRMMLPAKYTRQNKEYAGPVFRYADIAKLFPSPIFFNRQNDAAYFTLKHIFSNHLFNPVIKPEKDMLGQPVWNDQIQMENQQVWEN
jgi:hypothetical protein